MRYVIAASCVISLAATANAVTINWLPVGNPGNTADTTVESDGTTGYGSVGYNYAIAQNDVTVSQYVEFLNAKDPTGTSPLKLAPVDVLFPPSGHLGVYSGVNFSANNPVGAKYSVISGDGNHPISNVTFFSALRFANWMSNGQGNGDTESGAYTLIPSHTFQTDLPANANSISRNSTGTVFLPTENEWYKAAYYDPVTNSYFHYGTSSNIAPISAPPGSAPNSANYNHAANFPNSATDVGAYTNTTSPYGAYDMSGNVSQWTEASSPASVTNIYIHNIRGGASTDATSDYVSSEMRQFDQSLLQRESIFDRPTVGFRLVMVPEPSALMLAAMGLVALALWRRAIREPGRSGIFDA
jgi:formylglycine-generating enzyme required for sulfatase activity